MNPPAPTPGPSSSALAVCVRQLSRDALASESELSLFQKVLLVTDGSVTELLSLYAKAPIRAAKISQHMGDGPVPPRLLGPCSLPGPAIVAALLQREIVLMNGLSPLVYASSVFTLDALSSTTRTALVETEVPIGLLWRAEKSEMYREIVDMCIEHHPAVAAHFGLPADALLVSRSYRLRQGGEAMGLITEKFPITHFQD